jgi:hypothetical protein
MAKNRIYIPTFISSINYNPVRVLPHIYFYNGLKSCEPYYIQGYANGNTGSVVSNEQEFFPYFDNYEGNNPQSGSRSLLFFNEPSFYGTTPTGSLYTEYWSKYIDLLYNPRTRLFECSAIIPLADYFKMELNDIVEWRGNYYHLRAINNYNLKNGECDLQLLGPILGDILPDILPAIACGFDYTVTEVLTPTTTTTTLAPTTTTTLSPTTTTTLAPTTTTTLAPTTTTTTLPPEEACIEIDISGQIQEEFLDCGVFNLYNEYTASYFEDCAPANAPQDITLYITGSPSGPGDPIIYTLVIPSGSHSGTENVYTRIWSGDDCINRQSETYTITVGAFDPTYPTCSCP